MNIDIRVTWNCGILEYSMDKDETSLLKVIEVNVYALSKIWMNSWMMTLSTPYQYQDVDVVMLVTYELTLE